jgi:hypothetical protein
MRCCYLYFHLNTRHSCTKVRDHRAIGLCNASDKQALQEVGLMKTRRQGGDSHFPAVAEAVFTHDMLSYLVNLNSESYPLPFTNQLKI